MKFDFRESAKDHILIVAHRGVAAGNIPCNTIPAYETALVQGADVLEIDVTMSGEGTLFIFHPGMEPYHLKTKEYIPTMTDEQVKQLHYINYDTTPTQFGLHTLDELLEHFKGRCYINVDKFWGHPKEIYETLKRHNILDQIIVKSSPAPKVLDVLEDLAPELQFMSIVRDTNAVHEELMRRNINYIGTEVLFTEESAEVATPEFIERMHKDNILIWANSIIYNHKTQLTAGHSDDTAICGDPERGWGWLARRGYDFIQTDWPGMLIPYLKEKGLYYRK